MRPTRATFIAALLTAAASLVAVPGAHADTYADPVVATGKLTIAARGPVRQNLHVPADTAIDLAPKPAPAHTSSDRAGYGFFGGGRMTAFSIRRAGAPSGPPLLLAANVSPDSCWRAGCFAGWDTRWGPQAHHTLFPAGGTGTVPLPAGDYVVTMVPEPGYFDFTYLELHLTGDPAYYGTPDDPTEFVVTARAPVDATSWFPEVVRERGYNHVAAVLGETALVAPAGAWLVSSLGGTPYAPPAGLDMETGSYVECNYHAVTAPAPAAADQVPEAPCPYTAPDGERVSRTWPPATPYAAAFEVSARPIAAGPWVMRRAEYISGWYVTPQVGVIVAPF